jgi:hypothetical protein
MRKAFLYISLILGFNSAAFGATITASALTPAAVQAAIDSAANGDTVVLPAGSATWTTQVSIANKGVTIQGAGPTNTILTFDIATLKPMFSMAAGTATTVPRITGIGFVTAAGKEANTAKGYIQTGGWQTQKWRIDNCTFDLKRRGISTYGYGVIDHCTFNKNQSGSAQGVSVFGAGDASWNSPLSLGTDNAVYIETCTFNWTISAADSGLDMYNGGRVVVRNCVINNTSLGCHGLDSGSYRSPISWEIYNNTFNSTGVPGLPQNLVFRGGTGVVYNNTCTRTGTTPSTAIQVSCYRATGTTIFKGYKPWGFVGGDGTGVNGYPYNSYDGNTDSFGYPALDQIGACPRTDPLNTSAVKPGVKSTQGHQAAYQWNNTMSTNGGSPSPMRWLIQDYFFLNNPTNTASTHPNTTDLIKLGRDVIDATPMPGYTPLVYPHPLIHAAPASPADLRVTAGH